jgi:hypothetical protein
LFRRRDQRVDPRGTVEPDPEQLESRIAPGPPRHDHGPAVRGRHRGNDIALHVDEARGGCAAVERSRPDLLTGRPGAARTLYQGWYGDLQLAFDLRTERLLAVVGTQGASGTGVHAAIFDASGTTPIAPWRSYGGPGARAPAATASADGFLIVADAPAPDEPGPMEPCVEACDCPEPGTSALATGGLYAFSPGTGRAADRISPGRSPDGVYSPREAIAAIDAGGRVIVAGSSPESNRVGKGAVLHAQGHRLFVHLPDEFIHAAGISPTQGVCRTIFRGH